MRSGDLDPDVDPRRTPCEDEGRDWGDVSTNQGRLKIASKFTKLVEKHEQILLHSSKNQLLMS